ncbi:MAG: hypothetical protein ACFCUQ_18065 [Kiloniellales bacterium]
MTHRIITIDSIEILAIVSDLIRRLEESGALADIEPDDEFGYISESVFGVCAYDIAAAYESGDGVYFQLADGRLIPGKPGDYGPAPLTRHGTH